MTRQYLKLVPYMKTAASANQTILAKQNLKSEAYNPYLVVPKSSITLRIRLANRRQLDTVFAALKPETERNMTGRSRALLEKKNSFLVLSIKAKDTVALRAASNAYLRWINSLTKVLELLENQE